MCTEIILDGDFITSLGELRARLGREPVYTDPDEYYNASTPGEYCLCGVNHEATAALIGRTIEWEMGEIAYVDEATRSQSG